MPKRKPKQRGRPQRVVSKVTKEKFAEYIRLGSSPATAALATGLPRKTAADLEKRDADFKALMEQARADGLTALEHALRKSIINGVAEGSKFAMKIAIGWLHGQNKALDIVDPERNDIPKNQFMFDKASSVAAQKEELKARVLHAARTLDGIAQLQALTMLDRLLEKEEEDLKPIQFIAAEPEKQLATTTRQLEAPNANSVDAV